MPTPAPRRPTIPQQQTTTGPTAAVPCPWGCGHKNDFRPLVGAEMGGMGEGSIGIETGSVLGCDGCKRLFRIVAIEPVTVFKLTPFVSRKK